MLPLALVILSASGCAPYSRVPGPVQQERFILEPADRRPDISPDPVVQPGESRLGGLVQVVEAHPFRRADGRLHASIQLASHTDRPLDLLYRIRFFDRCGRAQDGPGVDWRPLHLEPHAMETLVGAEPRPGADSFSLDVWDKSE